jgi:hypothetical protein
MMLEDLATAIRQENKAINLERDDVFPSPLKGYVIMYVIKVDGLHNENLVDLESSENVKTIPKLELYFHM